MRLARKQPREPGHAGLESRHGKLKACSTLTHPAHARIGAGAAARAHGQIALLAAAIGVRGERGKLLCQMPLPTRRAFERVNVGAPAHEFFEAGSAILAFVFVNGHYSITVSLLQCNPSWLGKSKAYAETAPLSTPSDYSWV